MPIPPILIRNDLHPDPGLKPLLLLHGDSVHVPQPPFFDVIGAFVDDMHGGLVAAGRSASGFGFIDGEGGWIVAPTLQAAHGFGSDGLARFKDGGLWGYRDLRGEVAIAPQFEDAAPFHHGLAAVRIGGQWRYIGTDGVPAFDGNFFQAGEFGRNGLAFTRATRFGKFGFIDRMGSQAIAPQFRRVEAFSDLPLAPASIDEERYGLIDASGQWVVLPTYARIDRFNPDGYAYCQPSTWHRGCPGGYLDRDGREVIPFLDDLSDSMAAGLARLGRRGYAGVQGPLAISTPLAWADDFNSAGFAVARASIARAGAPQRFDEPWGVLRADGHFQCVPDGVLEPLTDANRQIVWPEHGTALAPFATRDGNVALLDRTGAIAFRLERQTAGALETVVLRNAQGRDLWHSEPHAAAARVAPFFDPRPEDLLEGLDDCGQVVGLATLLLAQTRRKLAALAAGEPMPAGDGGLSAIADPDDEEEDESGDDGDGDGDPSSLAAQVRTSQRVFRAFADEPTWSNYEFLVDQRCQAMERVFADMGAALTGAFGAASTEPDDAGCPAGEEIRAWAVGDGPQRLWLGLRACMRTGDGTFWCHVWLHCKPSAVTLATALAAQPRACLPIPDKE